MMLLQRIGRPAILFPSRLALTTTDDYNKHTSNSSLLVQAMVNPSTSLGLGVTATLSTFPLSSRQFHLQLLICRSTSQHSTLSWSRFCTIHWTHIPSQTSGILHGTISAKSTLGILLVTGLGGTSLGPCTQRSRKSMACRGRRRFLQTQRRCLVFTQQHTSPCYACLHCIALPCRFIIGTTYLINVRCVMSSYCMY